ncbi:MAG: thiamine-phosphate kinase [Acidobacteriia bacterium]|nr:thiamine-phosphate kinase [Terriglobia bacterium]
MPLKERELIAKIRKMAGHPGSPKPGKPGCRVVAGIGDDCAVLGVRPGHEILVTTDFSLEGIHFRREWQPASVIGHRCLVRGLSDVAAMGGEPLAAFLSLALPKNIPQRWVDEFFNGLLKLARRHGVSLAGGDVAQSPKGVMADIVVVGQVPKGEALMRSGATAEDGIYVTGELGGAAVEIRGLRARPTQGGFKTSLPEPRIKVGQALREIASACIDVSDGLSTDLSHICEESRVGAVVEAEAVPVARGATLDLALHGGEDYELLFTSAKPVPERVAGVKVTLVGEVVGGRKMSLVDAAGRKRELEAGGWEHFR